MQYSLKLILLNICVFFFSFSLWAQSPPEAINYQAVARSLAGVPLVNQSVTVDFSILQGSSSGTVVYSETHNKTTNQFGLFTAEIGLGTVNSGIFSSINWGNSIFFLQVTVNGEIMPATQLLSVPYALHAKTANTGVPGADGHNSLINSTIEPPGVNCANGGYFIQSWLDLDDDGAISSGETPLSYYICNGVDGTNGLNGANGVGIDSTYHNADGTLTIFYSDNTTFTTADITGPVGPAGTTYYPGNGITFNGDTIINNGDADSNPTNELQIISISNDTIFLSNGGSYVVLPSSSVDSDWSQGAGVVYNTTDYVGIGTSTPFFALDVVSTDTVLAAFRGNNPNYSAVSVANSNPNADVGFILLSGADTAIFGLNPTQKLLVLDNSTTGGHIGLNADSSVISYAEVIGSMANKMIYNQTNSIYNETDSIFSFSPTGTIVNVNQGMFLTDSLYVLGSNAFNPNWVLANDGIGQAVWKDPSTLGLGGSLWQQNSPNIYFNTGNVGIGNTNPTSPLTITSAVGTDIEFTGGFNADISSSAQLSLNSFGSTSVNATQLFLQTSNTDRLVILNNGNVGIGNNSPTTNLDVVGRIKTDSITISGGAIAGAVLTATDAFGNAEWQLPSSSGDGWGVDTVNTVGSNVIGSGTVANPLQVLDNDTSSINELQVLSISNDTIFLSNGGYVQLPSSSSLWTQNGGTLYPSSINSKVGVGITTPISNFQIGPQLHLDSITGPGGFNYNIYTNNLLYNGSNWVRSTNGTGIASYMGGYEYGIELYGNGAAGSNATSITAQFTIDSTRARITTKQDGLTITNESDTSLYLQSNASNNPTIIFNNQGWSTGLRSSSTPSSNLLFSLPNNHGNPGEIMSTDGFGNMSWIAPSSGSLWTDASPNIYYNSGNVGIGTGVSPQGKLSILHNGNVSSPGIYMENPNNGAASGLNRISMFNSSVTNKFWEMAAGVNTGGDAISAWTVSYDNGSTYDQLLAVYGDKKIAVGNISAANSSTFDVFGTTTMHDALTIDNGSSNPYTFPVVDGTISGQVLTTDALGNVTWQSPAVATTFWNGSAGAVYPSTISDKVGIGTATPNANLHVYGANPTMFIQDSQTTSAAYPSLQLGNTDGIGNFVTQGEISIPGSGDYMQIGATDAIRFNTNFSERMVISNTGNVGIGLSSPTARLEVLGNTDIQAQIRSVRAAGSTAIFGGGQTGGYIGTLSNHEFKIMTNSTLAATYSSSGNYSIGDNVTNKDWAAIQSNTSQDKRALFIQSTGASIPSATIQTGNAGGFALSIPQGRVKIGTGTPTANLDLSGTFKYVDGNQGTGKILTSDANGNATWKEKKIAFYVGGGGSNNNSYVQSLTQGVKETLQFDQSISAHYYNDGNGYNPSTFHFKAPVAGVYKLHADIALAGAQVGYYYMEMMHSSGNGITSQEGFFNSVHQNRLTRTLTATVHLNAGDEVWIEYLNTTGGSSFYMANSSFSGHLVYAD